MTIAVYSCYMNDRRESKRVKILSHLLWPDADWWLWLDWNFRLVVPAEELVRGFENEKIVGFKHRFHKDAYEEHAACARMGKDNRDVMRRQIDYYRKDRFPSGFGLVECGILLRRNCAETQSFNETWWAEVEKGSSRDQLSVGYAAWKTGLKWACWEGNVFENRFTKCLST